MVEPSPLQQPTFSVVVATRNRPDQLANCLQSLGALKYPREKFEVIVVDDGSERPIEPVCLRFQDRMNLRYLRSPVRGVAGARNAGVALSRASFVAFIDDDVAVDPNWLSAMEDCLSDDSTSLVGGRVENSLTSNIYSTTAQLIVDAVYAYYNRGESSRFFACCNLAFSREGFLELGGFEEPWPLAAAEDRHFCRKWRARGWPMRFAPEAIARHSHQLNLLSFLELYFRYGRGACLYHRRAHGAHDEDTIVPKWPFYRECFRRALDRPRLIDSAMIILLMILWQFANAAGYFYERLRRIFPTFSSCPEPT